MNTEGPANPVWRPCHARPERCSHLDIIRAPAAGIGATIYLTQVQWANRCRAAIPSNQISKKDERIPA